MENCLKISSMLGYLYFPPLNPCIFHKHYHFLINAAQTKNKKNSLRFLSFDSSKVDSPPLASSLDTVIMGFCNFAFLFASEIAILCSPFLLSLKEGLFFVPVVSPLTSSSYN
jgi:hypothetical protein